jgi:hypothetical protein
MMIMSTVFAFSEIACSIIESMADSIAVIIAETIEKYADAGGLLASGTGIALVQPMPVVL